MCPKTPSIGIHDCCEVLRSNGIEKSESTLSVQIQAGLFPSWSAPSVDAKRDAPDISRARFIRLVKDFYELEEVYGI